MPAIRRVKISDLKPADFNPYGRTTESALRNLKKEIEADGRIIRPLDVIQDGSKYLIADGHRRHLIAGELGITDVPVTVHNWPLKDVALLWSKLNKNKRVTGQEWAEAFFRSNQKISLPPAVMHNVSGMIRIWGASTAERMCVQEHVNPSVVHVIGQLRVRITQFTSLGELSEAQIGNWLIKHRMQNAVNSLFNGMMPNAAIMRKVVACIRGDRAFKPYQDAA